MHSTLRAETASAVLPARSHLLEGPDTARRDRMLMRAALFQARRGLGETWPNPSVGAVIADPATGEILGSAVTARGGRPHAEVLALAEAGARTRGALMVTTLEPCAHFGLTPPCADAIASAGLSEVLYGSLDPDPRVSGAGVARLRQTGVAVRPAPLQDEASWLNLGHILRINAGRPFVQLKLAVDRDGLIAGGEGQPVWVTGEDLRARAHLMRAEADAILIGRGTALADDPLLTCRLPGLGHRSPVRIVLTGKGELPAELSLFTEPGPPLWVFAGAETPSHIAERLEKAGAVVISPRAKTGEGGCLPIGEVLSTLAERGITRLLVEGGPRIARAFMDSGAVDEIVIFRGKSRMPPNARKLQPFVDAGIELISQSGRFIEYANEPPGEGRDGFSIWRSREYFRQ